MIKKYYLLSPGPTPIPDSVLSVAAEPIIHHRTPEFSEIFMQVSEGLKYVFGTKEDVFILTSSGTGAMETAVVNTLSPGDTAICINGGKFGERWGSICRAYGVNVKEIVIEWGADLTKEQLAAELKANPEAKAVFSTLSETSTGAIYDIKGFGEVVFGTGAILVVDGISGVGATLCPMDEWKIDVLLSGSQKSFMIPPGLAYIAFGPKAWKSVEAAKLPKFYFDAKKAKKNLEKQTTPWTPAISLIIQQKKALDIIKGMGMETLLEHHQDHGRCHPGGRQGAGPRASGQEPRQHPDGRKNPGGRGRQQDRQNHAIEIQGLYRRSPGPQQGQVLPHRAPGVYGGI